MNTLISRAQPIAPAVVRIGMSLVFLWFGVSQLTGPAAWTGLVPDWAASLFSGNATTVVFLNGWFEIVAGLSLIAGFQTRIAALLLAAHLFGIASTFGFSSIGIRDYGLSIATLSIVIAGADLLCVDRKLMRTTPEAPTA